MALTGQNYAVYQADDAVIPFTLKDDNGVLIDLTAVQEIVWTLGTSQFSDAVSLLQKTKAAAQITVTQSTAQIGTCTVTIVSGDLAVATIPPGQYPMEVFVKDQNAKRTTAAKGMLTINKSIQLT